MHFSSKSIKTGGSFQSASTSFDETVLNIIQDNIFCIQNEVGSNDGVNFHEIKIYLLCNQQM